MIIDRIANAGSYTPLIKNLDHALEFLKTAGELTPGRHEFDGGFIFDAQGVPTPLAERRDFEAHRSYADVMVVLEGSETVSYCPISELAAVQEYDGQRDISMHSGEGRDILVTVPAGYFYAVLPGEGHKPCVHLGEAAPYKKYILKCRQCD